MLDSKKSRHIPSNNLGDSLDKQTLHAYERYVLAQFKFATEDQIRAERQDAILSLIPGTLNYYHLFFLDLVKHKKKISDFSKEETKQYKQFNEQHGQTKQFYEIEMWLLLLNRLDELPKVNAQSSADDIE